MPDVPAIEDCRVRAQIIETADGQKVIAIMGETAWHMSTYVLTPKLAGAFAQELRNLVKEASSQKRLTLLTD